MNIRGQPLISRQTQTTGRAIVALTLGTILADAFLIPVEDLEVLGVKPGRAGVEGITWSVVLFLWVSHFVHWIGDATSYRAWNSSEKVDDPDMVYEGGGPSLFSTEAALKRVAKLMKTIEEQRDAKQWSPPKWLPDQLRSVQEDLSRLSRVQASFRGYAYSVLFGWYLVLPLLVTAGAGYLAFF